jgi:hypothetical protein
MQAALNYTLDPLLALNRRGKRADAMNDNICALRKTE